MEEQYHPFSSSDAIDVDYVVYMVLGRTLVVRSLRYSLTQTMTSLVPTKYEKIDQPPPPQLHRVSPLLRFLVLTKQQPCNRRVWLPRRANTGLHVRALMKLEKLAGHSSKERGVARFGEHRHRHAPYMKRRYGK